MSESKDQIVAELRAKIEELEEKLDRLRRGGRKPDGDRPLTVAERVAKHRASKKAAKT